MTDRIRAAILAATDVAAPHQRDIARAVGVSPLTLSHWRTGKRNPTPENLLGLGQVLLGRSRDLQHHAYELMRLAENSQSRKVTPTESAPVSDTLDLLDLSEGAA